jgi:cell division protein FtsI/penicillin-binding protein 2
MGTVAPLRAFLLIAALVATTSVFCAQEQRVPAQEDAAPTRSLFAQSAIQVLARDFPDPELSYLLFDAQSGVLLTSRWDHPDKPIPLGSLVKPFTALAYAESHEFRYPIYSCRGAATGCWQPKPHGSLDLVSAIAVSCNSYFRSMAENLSAAQMRAMAERFGLELPAQDSTGPALMGLGDEWQISPLRIAHAYLELQRRRDQAGVGEILEGMARSARRGTGSGVGRALQHSDALVKTGTAPCRHKRRAPGDGFVVALVPAAKPELLLMIRVHSVPGATASITAGRMLARLEQ